ncbi:MAG: hypothetical protein Aurels2KO_15460 [Aureliella sp.]
MLCVSFTFGAASSVTGQDPFALGDDDPFANTNPADNSGIFGGGAPAANIPAAPNTDANEEEEETSPIVLMLRENPPQTGDEMARGLKWMTQLRRMDEVDRLLSIASGWSPELKTQLARSAGSAFWIKLRSKESELSEASRATLKTISASPARQARSPQWIDRWATQLSSDKPGEVRLAELRLQDAGDAAIGSLVSKLTTGSTQISPTRLLYAIASFGPDGSKAIRAALSLDDSQKVGRVLTAIDPKRPLDFASELSVAALGNRVDAQTAQQLTNRIGAAYGKVPTAEQVGVHLKAKLDAAMQLYNASRTSPPVTELTVWRANARGEQVEHVKADAATQDLSTLSHWARQILALGVVQDSSQATQCKAILLQDALKRPQTDRSTALERIVQSDVIGPGDLPAILEQADHLQLHAAALGAMELIGKGARKPALAHLELLVQRLRDPRPAVRYTALAAINDIDPQHSFFGTETILATALEMAKLSSGPTVLIVGLHADIRQAAAQQLTTLADANILTANSARAAATTLRSGYPIEMVFVVDRVRDQSLYQLLQRLRGGRHSKALPIAVLTDDLTDYEEGLASKMPGVVRSVLSRNDSQMARVLSMLHAELDTQPLDAADRARFSRIGHELLVRVASDREKYAAYRISDLRNELSQFDLEIAGDAQAGLLSGLGTQESQWKLIQIAASPSPDAEAQSAAAASFATSVRQFGLVIRQDDIQRVYDLYNDLGPRNPGTAKALGQILDVIEARSTQSE